MKNFTTLAKKVSVIVIYIALWQIIAMIVNNKILMAGPVEVLEAIGRIVRREEFLIIIRNSLINIMLGFAAGFFVAVIMAFTAYKIQYFSILFKPVIHIFKSVPVASFIILILIWFGSDGIARVIAFIIGVPIIYSGTIMGLNTMDEKLLEMAKVYRITGFNKLYYIYYLRLKRRLGNDGALALGMCFKAGVAAEVIGVAKNTLGEQIYLSKIYLSTDELFGWTIIIMILAYGIEQIIRLAFKVERPSE